MSWPGAPFSLAPRERTGVQAQLGLSRVREFDASRLTADPEGLARALTALASGGIWHWQRETPLRYTSQQRVARRSFLIKQ